MDGKIFNIPFRTKSKDSDFICKDGEIENETVGGSENGKIGELKVEIEFAIVRESLKGWHVNPDIYPAQTLAASEPSMEYWNRLAAKLLSQFKSEATSQHLFVSPFHVMAAWKSIAGNYLSISKPVTLIPNSDIPLITTDDDISSTEPVFKVAAALGALYYKLSTPESLRDFVGKISSLEILVSEPLIKYDTYDYLLPLKHTTTDNYCESLDLISGIISQKRICTQTLDLAWKANLAGNSTIDNPLSDSTLFYPFAEIPLSSMAPDDPIVWQRVMAGNVSESKFSYETLTDPEKDLKSELLIIEGKGENINVTTRPLKLDNGGKLKTLSRVFLRGNYTPTSIITTVYGSRDMLQWWKIAKTKGGTVTALPRSPFRFFKIEISGLLHEGENLQGVSVIL